MTEEVKPIRPAASYALLIPTFANAVRPLGYALGVHGSMCRDLDLIAVPWRDEAAEPAAVVEAIRASVDGWTIHHESEPTRRPHGRLCYTIHFRNASGNSLPEKHPYIDLSIMPRNAALTKPAPEMSQHRRHGRREPYTDAGIRRLPCFRCGEPARFQWNACSDLNRWRPLCTSCDVALNAMVLRWMGHPDAESLIAAYAEKVAET